MVSWLSGGLGYDEDDDLHAAKKHSLSSKFEDIKNASFSRTKSHDLYESLVKRSAVDLDAQLARTEKTLKDVQGRTDTDKLRHRIQVIKDLIPLKRREDEIDRERARILHNLEEHLPAGLRQNVEPRRGALLKKVADWDLFGDRHDENAKVWLEYARFFDDFYRRDIDDRNNLNDPNDPNDPAPWGPKRRDRHPISAAGVEDIDGVCGEPTPLDRGADVKEVTHLLEVANAYAQYLVRNKSLDRDTELDRRHAMVRLLDLATSQQIGERDEMNKIFQEIPTLTFGDFIPELINLLHSDVHGARSPSLVAFARRLGCRLDRPSLRVVRRFVGLGV